MNYIAHVKGLFGILLSHPMQCCTVVWAIYPNFECSGGGRVQSKLTWNLNLTCTCTIHINVNFIMLDKIDWLLKVFFCTYFAVKMTIRCLACFEGISMPGDNKVCCCSCARVSSWVGSLLPSWTKNWGSSRTDIQDWNICPFSPWLLLLKQVKKLIILLWSDNYKVKHISINRSWREIKNPNPREQKQQQQQQKKKQNSSIFLIAVACITNNYHEIKLFNFKRLLMATWRALAALTL